MIESLAKHYEIEKKAERLFKIRIDQNELLRTINFIGSSSNFMTLSQITCTDWIEDEHFAITYIFTTLDRKHTFMVQTMVTRENTKVKSISAKFAQAEIMERDLAEMYGIDFIGNDNLKELSLENWIHTPPLRREFDSLEFVNEHLTFREGRDDNIDTKAEAKRLRVIKKAEKEALKKAKEEAQMRENQDAK